MRPESKLPSAREAAAAWHDRLHREKVNEETRSAFARWLIQSPENQRLYEAVDEAWLRLQNASEDPGILALRHETALRLTRRTSGRLQPIRWAAAAVLVLGAAAVLMSLGPHPAFEGSLASRLRGWIEDAHAAHYATAVGERLAVTLTDGSQVTLDTDSELKIGFTKAERGVRLIRGQAFFEVAKDHDHPFVVETQNRRFVAVGTAFDVRVDGEQVRVTMVEGTVRVERADGGSGGASGAHGSGAPSLGSGSAAPAGGVSPEAVVTTLTAGEQLITDAARQDHVRAADPERSTSWRRGQIIFDNTRLADAVAELNRYSDVKIELSDPALADLRLSGAFATGRPTLFLEAITSYFPVEITHADEHAVLLGAKK